MNRSKILTIGSSVLAAGALAAAASSPAAGARQTSVSVRVEGSTHTLLSALTITAPSGQIHRGGHSCPAASALGALNAATHGSWSGKWYSGLGFEVTRILGETADYSKTKTYWELFVNEVAASAGACSTALHPGERLLFAAVPATGTEYPLGLQSPPRGRAGHPFTVKVVFYDAKGRARPLAGATVSVARQRGRTGRGGTITVTPGNAGTYTVNASDKGYIRAARTTVHVS